MACRELSNLNRGFFVTREVGFLRRENTELASLEGREGGRDK